MRAYAPSVNWRINLAEFTGERLIPGEVDVDLLNEHMARYHFAVRLARGKRVLDAGCGAGYGSAELADVAESVTGIDIAPEAVEYARAHYALPNLALRAGVVHRSAVCRRRLRSGGGVRSHRAPGELAGFPAARCGAC